MSAPATLASAAQKFPWEAGRVLGERYRLVSPIGAGAMGQVWRAEHVALGTPLAVKLLDLTVHEDVDAAMSRFLQEARAAARLQSPHVVHVLDFGVEKALAYIAMELLEGESLADRLARQRTLAPEALVKVVREVAQAIEKAHAIGILHRDIKPANVFLARVEGREVVKVLDFGIAKALTPDDDEFVSTRAGTVLGTPAYMSPEQVLGNPLDGRSDLWQLGVLAFECACGQLPFHGNTLGKLFMNICSSPLPTPSSIATVPPGFDAWFARAAQRNIAARFDSAGELADALEQVLVGTLDGFASTGRSNAIEPRAASRSRRALWVGAAVALGLLATGVVVTSSRSPGSGPGARAEGGAVAAPPASVEVGALSARALSASSASAPSANAAPPRHPEAPARAKPRQPSRLKRVDRELGL